MRIAVIGTPGPVLNSVVATASGDGHDVIVDTTVFTEEPAGVPERERENLPLHGDATNSDADGDELDGILFGVEAVIISAAAAVPLSTRSLWKVIGNAELHRVRRVVVLLGLDHKMPPSARLLRRARARIRNEHRGLPRTVHEKLESALQRSTLSWTIVYTVPPVDQPRLKEWDVIPLRFVAKISGLVTIPIANLAQTLVEQATRMTSTARSLVVAPRDRWLAMPLSRT
ncbi:hypothetical protein [Gordonia terrae]